MWLLGGNALLLVSERLLQFDGDEDEDEPLLSRRRSLHPEEALGGAGGLEGGEEEESVSAPQERILPLRGFFSLICCNIYSPGGVSEQHHRASHWSNTVSTVHRAVIDSHSGADRSCFMCCMLARCSYHSLPFIATNVFLLSCVSMLFTSNVFCLHPLLCVYCCLGCATLFFKYRETYTNRDRHLFMLLIHSHSGGVRGSPNHIKAV